MNNLQETLKKIGFEPDDFGNLALCVGEPDKTYALIMISDYDTGDVPTDETKKLLVGINVEDKNGTLLDCFQNIINL